MINDCIYSIDLTTTNREVLSISSDDFEKMYISNIDDTGDEIPYKPNKKDSKILDANFFMIKILNGEYGSNQGFIQRLYERQDIFKVTLRFTNGKKQEFELPKKRVVNDGILQNKYQYTFFEEENLCIIISDKKIKFMENLFI